MLNTPKGNTIYVNLLSSSHKLIYYYFSFGLNLRTFRYGEEPQIYGSSSVPLWQGRSSCSGESLSYKDKLAEKRWCWVSGTVAYDITVFVIILLELMYY